MEREEVTKAVACAFKIVNTVTQPSRAKIFELISKEKMTFNDLLGKIGMSKSGLSTNILELSKIGLIVSKPSRTAPTYYELTPFGKQIHSYLHSLESLLIQVPAKLKRIAINADGFIELFGKNDTETLKTRLKGKEIILPLRSYVKLVDWLDEKIAEGEDSERFQKIEDILYDEGLVKVVESYENLETALDVECYMRRQKKLTPENSELVAVAEDRGAVVASANAKVIVAATQVGRQAFDLDDLLKCVKAEQLYIFAEVESKPGELHRVLISSKQDIIPFGPEKAIERAESSSDVECETVIQGGQYEIAWQPIG